MPLVLSAESLADTCLSLLRLRPRTAAVSTEMAEWFTKNVEAYYAEDGAALQAIMRENALRLFPRLARRMRCAELGAEE